MTSLQLLHLIPTQTGPKHQQKPTHPATTAMNQGVNRPHDIPHFHHPILVLARHYELHELPRDEYEASEPSASLMVKADSNGPCFAG